MRSPRRPRLRRQREALDALLSRVYLGITGLFLAAAPPLAVLVRGQDPARWPLWAGCVLLALLLIGAGLLLVSLRAEDRVVQRWAAVSMVTETSLTFLVLVVPIALLLVWSHRRRAPSLRAGPHRIRPRRTPLWARAPAPGPRTAAPSW